MATPAGVLVLSLRRRVASPSWLTRSLSGRDLRGQSDPPARPRALPQGPKPSCASQSGEEDHLSLSKSSPFPRYQAALSLPCHGASGIHAGPRYQLCLPEHPQHLEEWRPNSWAAHSAWAAASIHGRREEPGRMGRTSPLRGEPGLGTAGSGIVRLPLATEGRLRPESLCCTEHSECGWAAVPPRPPAEGWSGPRGTCGSRGRWPSAVIFHVSEGLSEFWVLGECLSHCHGRDKLSKRDRRPGCQLRICI